MARQAGSGHASWASTLEAAAREVFLLMLGSELEPPPHPAPDAKLDLTAVVGLAGPLCGILTVGCSQASGARMAARMLGVAGSVSDPDLWDALGEIGNMVAGHFKGKVDNLGEACMLSVPTVITGADYALHTSVNEHIRRVLLFEGAPVVFALEVHNDYPVGKTRR